MRRPRPLLVGLWAVVSVVPALAGPHLQLVAVARPEPTVTVELTATNDGDAPATIIKPTLTFDHRDTPAPPQAQLAPGARYTWTIALGPPPGAGSFPITIAVEYHHVDSTPEAAVTVTTVATAGVGPPGVQASLEVPSFTHVANVRLTLTNARADAVGGRLAVVLPPPLFIEPASQPVAVPAKGQIQQPLVIERKNAPARTYSMFAVYEFQSGAEHHTLVATGKLEATAEGAAPRRPFWIGVGALCLALAVVGFAIWKTAPDKR